jgi:hypothetical protein
MKRLAGSLFVLATLLSLPLQAQILDPNLKARLAVPSTAPLRVIATFDHAPTALDRSLVASVTSRSQFLSSLPMALIGAALAVLDFIATLVTGNDFYTYGAGLIAIVILVYCYPTKSSWIRTIQRFARTDEEPKSSLLALD